MTSTCAHCGKDLVEHHHRNLKCPTGKTIYRETYQCTYPCKENGCALSFYEYSQLIEHKQKEHGMFNKEIHGAE